MKFTFTLSLAFSILQTTAVLAQVSIHNGSGTDPNASSMMDVQSTDKGMLVPRVALVSRDNASSPIASPANSLLIFNTATANTGAAAPPNDITPGYYYWDQNASVWQRVMSGYGNLNTGTGSNGHVSYWTGASTQGYDNTGNFFWDATNDRLGIGTTSPSTSLHVSNAAGEQIRIQSSGTEADIYYVNNTGNWQVGTNNSGNGTSNNQFYIYDNAYRLTVQNGSGNVGIGLTTPQRLLDINGTTRMRDWLSFGSNDDIGRITWGSDRFFMNGYAGKKLSLGSNAAVDQLLIDLAGNVGIGDTGPTVKLKVAGDIEANSQIRATGWLTGTGTGQGTEIGVSSGYSYLMGYNRTSAAYQPVRIVGSTIDLRHSDAGPDLFVNTAGNVGINTNTPAQKLDVNGNVNSQHLLQGPLMSRPLATWSVAGGSTGAVIIKLPGGTGNYGMLHIEIDVYEYGATGATKYIIGGHNWSSQWYNYNCHTIGTSTKKVRLAFKDGQYAIVIGETGSSWSYGHVALSKITNGGYYSGIIDLGGTYTITQDNSAESYSWISTDLNKNVLQAGSGITNYLARWTSPTTLGTGVSFDNGTNVGISTAAPAAKLHISGGGAIIGTTSSGSNNRTLTVLNDGQAQVNFGSYPYDWSPAIQIQNNDNTKYTWISSGGSGIYAAHNARYLAYGSGLDFFTGSNAFAATLTSGGNLGVGTTTANNRLHVYGPASNYPAFLGSPDGYLQLGPANTGWCHFATDRPRYYFNTNITVDGGAIGSYDENLTLQRAGVTGVIMSNAWFDIYSTTGTTAYNYYYWSDERLKKNIRPLGNVLNKLNTINSVYFEYDKARFTDRESINEDTHIGFIAQEVRNVFPELVAEKEDGKLVVDYAKMTPILLQSIKELKAEQDVVNQRLADQDAIIAQMRMELDQLKSSGR